MKISIIALIAILFLAGCASNNNISARGGNNGVSGGVSTSIRF